MRKTVTRVLTIVALCLFVAVAVTAIVLACVKRDYNQVINSDVKYITVMKQGGNNTYRNSEDSPESKKVFDELMNKYYAGTKESILSSMFQGAYSKEAEAEVVKLTTSVTALSANSTTYYLQFDFNDEQTLKVNGVTYEDKILTSQDKTVKFKSVILAVENNTTLNKVTMYIVDSTYYTTSYYQVKYTTHHSALFDYITGLDYPGLA